MSLNDVFGEFPGRPDHPDFAKLADIVLQQDGKTEDEEFDFGAYLGEFIDPASLAHMAQQRAARLMARNGMNPSLNARVKSMFSAVYLDAFMVGNLYRNRTVIATLTNMEREAHFAIEENTGSTAAHAAYLHTRWEAFAECLRAVTGEEDDTEG